MRAAVLTELNKIEIQELPVPEVIRETDVQVRVKAVGICGTDLHMFHETRPDVQLPRIMGHELSGQVEALGSAVTRVKVGDRVEKDQMLLIIEAMKMETAVTARMSGTVESIEVAEGDVVKAGQLLMRIK